MRIVELSAPGVHKAAGVASAAKLLGRDPADVLAFGDAPNDMRDAGGGGVGGGDGQRAPRRGRHRRRADRLERRGRRGRRARTTAPRILRSHARKASRRHAARRRRRRDRPRHRGRDRAAAGLGDRCREGRRQAAGPASAGARRRHVRGRARRRRGGPRGAAPLDGPRAGRGRAPRVPGREDHDRPADRQRLLLRLPVRRAHHRGRSRQARERDAAHPEDASTPSPAPR